jgi:cytochrome oxidase Cu insertion factor (SCO1/SenC/PrrC family)
MTHRATIVASIAFMVTVLAGGGAWGLEVGQKAPDFTLPAQDGKPVKLADLLGKGPVVLYTFVQAFTPT